MRRRLLAKDNAGYAHQIVGRRSAAEVWRARCAYQHPRADIGRL
jgi:hypothetical protein